MTAVATQMDLALLEAEGPAERLGETVARMGAAFAAMGSNQLTAPTTATSDLDLSVDMPVDWVLLQLRKDFACAIEDLQFHDRMVQHLSHLSNHLTGAAALLSDVLLSNGTDSEEQGDVAEAWDGLRRRLFGRLISDTQRQFLQMVLPATSAEKRITNEQVGGERSPPGSVELF